MIRYIQVKELPNIGALGYAKAKLQSLGFKQCSINFTDKVSSLGISCFEGASVDVYSFGPNGYISGWAGKYSGASAFSSDIASKAVDGGISTDLPPDVTILEIFNYYKGNRAKLYLNTQHLNKLITSNDVTDREKSILKIFSSYKSSYRESYLYSLKATVDELNDLIGKKYLKIQKNKTITINNGKYNLCGCQITLEGKNAIL